VLPIATWKMSKVMSTTEQRVELVRLAIADNANFQLSRVTLIARLPSYTYETLRLLRAQYPATSSTYHGPGFAADIGNWHNADEIVRLAQLVVCARPGVRWTWPNDDLLHACPASCSG